MIAYLAEKQANLLAQTIPNATPKMIARRKKLLEKELQAVANGMVDKLVADLNSLGFIRFVYNYDRLFKKRSVSNII
jgi:hypothetical protein